MVEATDPGAEKRRGGRERPSLPQLRGRYRIHPDQPMPESSTPSTAAFAATDQHGPDRKLFAYVCEPTLPARGQALGRLRQSTPSGMLPLVDRGIIDWPLAGCRCLAILYQQPLGGTLADAFRWQELLTAEQQIPRRIIAPIVRALRGLEAIGVAHRSIRPNNLLFLDEARKDLVLGDCVTVPPAFDQATVFEPIERAMAAPAGRGDGGLADDLYALGVSLALLLAKQNPVAGLSDAEVLKIKVQKGSYALLCDRERIPLSLIEPLRGLLCDDPNQRWGLDDLEMWVKGQRIAPPRKPPAHRASAPLAFAGAHHLDVLPLVQAMIDHVEDAAAMIRRGELAAWLAQRLNAGDLARRVAEAVAASQNTRDKLLASDHFLVSRVAVNLDPEGPIRYRQFRAMIDGIGPAMAVAWLRDGDRQTAAEAISLGLPGLVLATAAKSAQAVAAQQAPQARLRRIVDARGAGFGAERCLYELNPTLACQSSMLAKYQVVDIPGLLDTLEGIADGCEGLPMDRHIAAFIAARFDADIDDLLAGLLEEADQRSALATLRLLAAAQRRFGVGPLPKLAHYIGARLGHAVTTYRSRALREHVRQQLEKGIGDGDLQALYEVIENTARRQTDTRGFVTAARDYGVAEARIAALDQRDRSQAGGQSILGQRAAAAVATVLSIFAIIVCTVAMVK